MTEPRVVALAPTFNNARTVAGVIDALRAAGLPVIVVNDGSTDSTIDILRGRTDCVVVHHETNRGKAAALRSGFDVAARAGYTHVLTFDTDGQHDPADIPTLLRATAQHPAALILGARDRQISGYPVWNRIGRSISNALVRLHSGVNVTDSQCGLRIYPIQTRELHATAPRYGFETEILVRCGWAKVEVAEVPVKCVYEISSGRVSHFRPWRDSISAVFMHTRLLTRSLWPVRPPTIGVSQESVFTGTIARRLARWLNPLEAWRAIRHDAFARRRFAAAVSVGVFVANLPVYGLQSVISLMLARRLNLHPLAVLAGSHLSTPPIGPLLIVAAISVGHLMLHGTLATAAEFDPSRVGYVELLRRVAIEWTIGSLVCGAILSAISFVLMKVLMKCVAVHPAHATAADERSLATQGVL